MGVVVTQALVALWFFRLFRSVDSFAAGAIAVFGMVNAVAILGSAASLATALDVALEPVGDPGAAQLLYLVSDNLWGVGALFFGLWLIPMGWCVLQSGSMPRALGWVLIVGGVGYVLSAFLRYLVPDAGALADLAAIPATIGELWIIGQPVPPRSRAARLRCPLTSRAVVTGFRASTRTGEPPGASRTRPPACRPTPWRPRRRRHPRR